MRGILRLGLAQTGASLLDPEANVRTTREILGKLSHTQLVAFPELSLTGYALGGRARALARPLTLGERLTGSFQGLPDAGPEVLLGLPESAMDGRIFNSSVRLSGGRIQDIFRKTYLPTYGMFDERRIFTPAPDPPRVMVGPNGWKIGVLICEDLWHPSLAWLLSLRGAELLVVQAAAPGRDGYDPATRSFRSMEAWTTLARATALQLGLFVALVNRVGVEAGLTFGGGSLLIGPDGEIQQLARGLEPEILTADLDPDSILEARSPYSHLRDEDPSVVLRALLEDIGIPMPQPAHG